MGEYEDAFRASTDDPEAFWLGAAQAIDWHVAPTRALDASRRPFYRWFPDGELNVCHNALDRHVDAGRGEQSALIYDSPVTGTKRIYTYAGLRDEVARFAGVLAGLGVGRGDRVVIYMPMVPEAAVAMLACARIGAVHSVVFGGFASRELAVRIDDAAPSVIVSASCGIEGSRVIEYKPLLDQAVELAAHTSAKQVILQRPQAEAVLGTDDVDWAQAVASATPADCVPVAATDPLYILYTSGTTGKPKGVVRDGGGYAVALRWSMRGVYDVGAGETIFTASDVGWVVGHSYIVYAPLLAGRRPCCTRANRLARRMPGSSGGWSLSTGRRACSPRRRHSERSRRRTRTASSRRATTSRGCDTSSSPGSDSTPRPTAGLLTSSAFR